jgi:hypothetical protein
MGQIELIDMPEEAMDVDPVAPTAMDVDGIEKHMLLGRALYEFHQY